MLAHLKLVYAQRKCHEPERPLDILPDQIKFSNRSPKSLRVGEETQVDTNHSDVTRLSSEQDESELERALVDVAHLCSTPVRARCVLAESKYRVERQNKGISENHNQRVSGEVANHFRKLLAQVNLFAFSDLVATIRDHLKLILISRRF